jgi:RNA polymerase sigma-70 factor (ECF subfamily)
MMEEGIRRSAVERAYRENVDHVYRVAYAILRDPEAAGDATHDAFARAYERWEQYDANRPVRAWLHGIVAHTALDAVRRRRVREHAVPVMGRVAEIGGARVADDLSGDAARREIVDQGLASLAPQARAAVVLRHYYGYDYAEIASFLRTSPGNVGSLLSRAHADLRRLLAVEAPPVAGDGQPANRRVAGASGAGRDRNDR